jgi:hypothetical protein
LCFLWHVNCFTFDTISTFEVVHCCRCHYARGVYATQERLHAIWRQWAGCLRAFEGHCTMLFFACLLASGPRGGGGL